MVPAIWLANRWNDQRPNYDFRFINSHFLLFFYRFCVSSRCNQMGSLHLISVMAHCSLYCLIEISRGRIFPRILWIQSLHMVLTNIAWKYHHSSSIMGRKLPKQAKKAILGWDYWYKLLIQEHLCWWTSPTLSTVLLFAITFQVLSKDPFP